MQTKKNRITERAGARHPTEGPWARERPQQISQGLSGTRQNRSLPVGLATGDRRAPDRGLPVDLGANGPGLGEVERRLTGESPQPEAVGVGRDGPAARYRRGSGRGAKLEFSSRSATQTASGALERATVHQPAATGRTGPPQGGQLARGGRNGPRRETLTRGSARGNSTRREFSSVGTG